MNEESAKIKHRVSNSCSKRMTSRSLTIFTLKPKKTLQFGFMEQHKAQVWNKDKNLETISKVSKK